jgi:hypothetical protein
MRERENEREREDTERERERERERSTGQQSKLQHSSITFALLLLATF